MYESGCIFLNGDNGAFLHLRFLIMIINIEISDQLLQNILSYGDVLLSDLTEDDFLKIKESFETRFVNRIADEPHYAFEDYIEGLLP